MNIFDTRRQNVRFEAFSTTFSELHKTFYELDPLLYELIRTRESSIRVFADASVSGYKVECCTVQKERRRQNSQLQGSMELAENG